MELDLRKLTDPTPKIAETLERWENDPLIVPFARPNKDQKEIETRKTITADDLKLRLEHEQMYLIYLEGQLVGEMDYQIDPSHLYKKEAGTAWIGILIGEETARGKGIGYRALQYLEKEIKEQGWKRIELGVFEFNTNAIKLYQKLGYREIGRIKDFTFWQERMWQDIRMEKYL
jgi:RimJ/RimL family protein N-acetyltransferase